VLSVVSVDISVDETAGMHEELLGGGGGGQLPKAD
jgi:hypothetical protein